MSLKVLGDINENIQIKINETKLKTKQIQKEDLQNALDMFRLDDTLHPEKV
ncbi:hypothetical protein [Methylotuvimicrobium sp. KM1]|uniref:hypothetical protein n=1 Tax=Methylotuvimicrobium sp. KM1 TaxID=3377707 RepID=UPI00384CF859